MKGQVLKIKTFKVKMFISKSNRVQLRSAYFYVKKYAHKIRTSDVHLLRTPGPPRHAWQHCWAVIAGGEDKACH